jgi:cytochrome P450
MADRQGFDPCRPMLMPPARHAVAAFDLRALPPQFYEDPYPTYRDLQCNEPVRRMPDGSLFVTRHADLVALYRNAAAFSSDKQREFAPKFGADSPLFRHHTTSLVFNDAPLHTNVRRLIVGALTVRAIAAMQPALERLVDSLLDAAEARGSFDAIEHFAAAIPVEVIGNLLDVPHAERGPLRDWSLAILGALEPTLSEQQLTQGNAAVGAFLDYLRLLVAERRRRPGDPAKDVLTRLIQGDGEQRLDEAVLLQNCIFILNAGHETTTNLIGNALEALLRFPDQRDRLLAEPELIRSAVEEFLRYESSNQLGNRVAVAPAVIGGVPVPVGTYVTLCIGAANRDPAVFAEPDRLDLGREPNRHLAFGLGVHQCAGLTLARLEARVAIQRFVTRFPRYELAGPPMRGGRARFRGFLALPMRVR